MGMIVDSCIWVGLAAGSLNRDAVISAAGEEPVFTSVIFLGELNFAVQACPDTAERAADVSGFLNWCGVDHLEPVPNLRPPDQDLAYG